MFRVPGRERSDRFKNVRNSLLHLEPDDLALDWRKNALIAALRGRKTNAQGGKIIRQAASAHPLCFAADAHVLTRFRQMALWRRPAAVEEGVCVTDGNSHSPTLTSLGVESQGHVAHSVVILADLPLISRCKFIYGKCAALPIVVIVDDDEAARNHAHGKVFEDTLS